MQISQHVNVKSVAKYVLLPGIIPRLKEFAHSGFGWLAYLMATIFGSVRLLPPGHPYLNPANTGRYGIRHVIVIAANRLVLKKENIDQILVFTAIVMGFVLLVMQFVLLVFGLLMDHAFAASSFVTENPQEDIALTLLDHVFGVQGLSCTDGGATCTNTNNEIPNGFHQGLHAMFRFYSTGILLIAILVFLYYVVLVIGETTTSGTPFGRRFNHAWAPLRLIVALGLLVPINSGLNSAQYLTLYAAKWGSGFATNGWIRFNSGLNNALGVANDEELIANPGSPENIPELVQFMSAVRTCEEAYTRKSSGYNEENGMFERQVAIMPYLVTSSPEIRSQAMMSGFAYEDALDFYRGGDIGIVFGHYDEEDNKSEKGAVAPYCGKITVMTSEIRDDQAGSFVIQEAFFDMVLDLFWNDRALGSLARRAVSKDRCSVDITWPNGDDWDAANLTETCDKLPEAAFRQDVISPRITEMTAAYDEARNTLVAALQADDKLRIDPALLNRGWAGAGIWYNRLAEINGALFGAAIKTPVISAMPLVIEKINSERRGSDQNVMLGDLSMYKSGGDDVDSLQANGEEIAPIIIEVLTYWSDGVQAKKPESMASGNIIIDTINFVFGINGLADFRSNADVNPLAALSAVGKSIMDRTMIYMTVAVAGSAIGGLSVFANAGLAELGAGVSSMFIGLISSTMAIGFVLYYVLPFLPFLYFFFAVGSWVKGIFEAMVGVPLWALAHLKIDGEGLPGDMAKNGYFLIFEIFIRPILTVFGLIASVLIFAALVRELNYIFDDVLGNLTGFSDCGAFSDPGCVPAVTIGDFSLKRGPIDAFFFTVIYTIMVYMIGTTSFKLIDRIPQSILRWMGAGVTPFADQTGDPAGGLTQYAAIGGASLSGQAAGALASGGRAAGMAAGGPLSSLFGRNITSRVAGSQ